MWTLKWLLRFLIVILSVRRVGFWFSISGFISVLVLGCLGRWCSRMIERWTLCLSVLECEV